MIRYHSFIAIMLIIMAFAVSACDTGAQETGEQATLFILPSLTPTDTPTETFTPTQTFTATFTPSPTVTFTPTFTASPTFTSTPNVTNTPVIVPTSTSNVTTPEILSFTSSVDTAAVGAMVTLDWEALGLEARMETVDGNGQIVAQSSVPLTASQEFTIPNVAGNAVTYRLVVNVNEQSRTQVVTINIRQNCSVQWFFANPPADAGCPSGPQQVGPGAFQTFADGLMIFVNAGNRNTIYALANQGAVGGFVLENTYGQETNQWDGTTNHCTQTPPAGQQIPNEMFNWMACSVFGPSGFWVNTIGFATGPIDKSNRTIQFAQNGEFYIDTPSGLVYRFEPITQGMISNRWSIANAPR